MRNNLQSGSFRLFIVVDEMNEHLKKIIAYISGSGTGLRLQALELHTYKTDHLEILAPQTHGEFVPTSPSGSAAITIDQALANCPDDQARKMFQLLLDRWKGFDYEIEPGKVGIAFKADVGGSLRSIFWASKGDLQAAFSEIEKYQAPADALKAFRSTLSEIKGFDRAKFLGKQQPIVKFALLTEDAIEKFVKAAQALVLSWRTADSV
ncbi:MAG: hypothetical protein JO121_13490 [Deltaproteobacteria bacterium]|nr:hypothetical protein [Deltaproteobacteria bacterium]